MQLLKILHITPHLGGGVGSVVLNWMKKDTSGYRHTIFSLDSNNNNDWKEVNDNFDNVVIYDNFYNSKEFQKELVQNINSSDIVILHWWNHPLLYDIMINFNWPECRLLIWNHVSGLHAPYVHSEKLVTFPDFFIFTSPVSFECAEIQKLSDKLKEKLDVVWSTIGIEEFENIERINHENFNVGFTGTVDFGKLNSSYIKMCANVKIADIQFIVCSGDSQEHLKKEARELNVYNKFSFEGRVPSVIPYLAKFDVFGYPLQPQHFGTCEQAIGEAMMAGCVPVVLNNPAERHIVTNNITGIVANSFEDYSKAIDYLYYNQDILNKLSKNARIQAKKLYDIKNTLNKWIEIFEKTMKLPKKIREWNGFNSKMSPCELYIESLGEYAVPLIRHMNSKTSSDEQLSISQIKDLFNTNSMFFSNNKGSVLQYLKFFPDDKYLQNWANILKF